MFPLIEFPDCCFCNIFFRAKRKEIKAFKESVIWQTDLSGYGSCYNYSDEEIPNEIDGELMGFENLLFVPLKGGQLLALDVETGKQIWMQDYNRRSGFYTIFGNKIYKHDGLSLIEIDAYTGKTIRTKIFTESEENELKQFYSLHYFWVYEDIIILYGNKNKIAIIDRTTFQLKDFLVLSANVPASRDNVIWHDNKLYVLDLTNTLHIFEK
jgi:outer membrane protein assembly factor BamB